MQTRVVAAQLGNGITFDVPLDPTLAGLVEAWALGTPLVARLSICIYTYTYTYTYTYNVCSYVIYMYIYRNAVEYDSRADLAAGRRCDPPTATRP